MLTCVLERFQLMSSFVFCRSWCFTPILRMCSILHLEKIFMVLHLF